MFNNHFPTSKRIDPICTAEFPKASGVAHGISKGFGLEGELQGVSQRTQTVETKKRILIFVRDFFSFGESEKTCQMLKVGEFFVSMRFT